MNKLGSLHPTLNKFFLFLYSLVLVLAFKEFFRSFSPFVSLPYALVLHKLTFDIISSTADRFILLICTILICLFQRIYFKNIIKIFGLNFYNNILYLSIGIFILYFLTISMPSIINLHIVITACLLILSSSLILSTYLLINQSQKLLSMESSLVFQNILVLILIIIIPIHFSALIYNIILPLSLPVNISTQASDLSFSFSFFPTNLTPALYSFFLFSWFWLPILKRMLSKRYNFKKTINFNNFPNVPNSCFKLKTELTLLAILMLIACFTGFWVYIDVSQGMVIGNDVQRYIPTLIKFEKLDLATRLNFFLYGRAGLHAFLSTLKKITGSSIIGTFKVAPAIIIMLNAVGTYFFMKSWVGNGAHALLAATLSIFSINTVVGMDNGILANWLSMALWFFMLSLISDLGDRNFIPRLLVGSLISIAVMLTHMWTWDVMMMIISLFTVQIIISKGLKNKRSLLLIFFITLNFIIRAVYLLNIPSHTQETYIARTSSIFKSFFSLGFIDYFERVSVLVYRSNYYSIFFILLIAIIGLVSYYFMNGQKKNREYHQLITSWLIICSIGALLSPTYLVLEGALISYIWRFIFLFPLHIPISDGILTLSSIFNRTRISLYQKYEHSYLLIYGIITALILLLNIELGVMFLLISLTILIFKIDNLERYLKPSIIIIILIIMINYTFRSLNYILPYYPS